MKSLIFVLVLAGLVYVLVDGGYGPAVLSALALVDPPSLVGGAVIGALISSSQ